MRAAGRAKILDFGLAKALRDGAGPLAEEEELTQSGMLVGTSPLPPVFDLTISHPDRKMGRTILRCVHDLVIRARFGQMKRFYEHLISEHFREERQMLFLMGPRQVGKTTTSREVAGRRKHACYLNWDNVDHQAPIVAGGRGPCRRSRPGGTQGREAAAAPRRSPQVSRLANAPQGFLRYLLR